MSSNILALGFQAGKIPSGFIGDVQALFNLFAANLVGAIDGGSTGSGSILTGQIGGTMPTTDIGIWLNNGVIYTFNTAAGIYTAYSDLPIGTIIDYAGSSLPTNYLGCDGSEVQNTLYPALFSALGTTYGSKSSSTFSLPDLRCRYTVGSGVQPPCYNDGDNPAAPTNIGALRTRTQGLFYGEEFIRMETKGTNSPTAIPNRLAAGSLFTTGNQITSSTPPSVCVMKIIRAA